jgi:hypothetical protein
MVNMMNNHIMLCLHKLRASSTVREAGLCEILYFFLLFTTFLRPSSTLNKSEEEQLHMFDPHQALNCDTPSHPPCLTLDLPSSHMLSVRLLQALNQMEGRVDDLAAEVERLGLTTNRMAARG